jgi:two-component system LytT family sensor kinase
MPRYFNNRKYRQFFVSVLLVLILLLGLNWISFKVFVQGQPYRIMGSIVFYIIPCFFILLWSIAYRILIDRVREEKKSALKQTENLKTELSFLRSQVSPHFMFNVLNNMVSLARKKSDQLEPSLIKLSSLLRYMLYETDEEKVSLQKEAEYLNSYIDLQQQRFGANVKLNVTMSGIEESYEIHPMLLIPFVENAFKHGTGMITTPEIDISLRAADGILYLDVKNRFNKNSVEVKDKASGIGLVNVQRRLKLLYEKKHRITINTNDDCFKVSLQIDMT